MNNQLKISTLGVLRVRLNGEPVSGLTSRKAAALLVYLVCKGRPLSREVLAELLWEERTQAQALSNLRKALASLCKHLDPCLTITRDSVALNPEAEGLALYQGDFLEGFYVRGGRGFEEWVTLEQCEVCCQLLAAFCSRFCGTALGRIQPIPHARWHWLVKPWVAAFPFSAPGHFIFKDVIIEPH